MLVALIMAGGKGSRFWPLSTEEKPKQFLKLIGNKTMLQMTVDRIIPNIPMDRIFICTGENYINFIREQIPNFPERNIIVEPEARNTTACITLSSFIINKYYPNCNMVVLPSDHLIREEKMFRNILNVADDYIKDNSNAIVTLGMKPNRAEIGYGYIEVACNINELKENSVIKIEKFKEKPSKEKAEEYFKSGRYLWNGGIFFWNLKSILLKLRKYTPNTYNALEEIQYIDTTIMGKFTKERYKYTDSISIDYSVLEKDDNLFVIPVDIGWDDVGSWEAVERYSNKDENGNIHLGNINSIDCINNLVIAANENIIIDDVSDIYIIENDGKILIGKKSKVSNIKNLKEKV